MLSTLLVFLVALLSGCIVTPAMAEDEPRLAMSAKKVAKIDTDAMWGLLIDAGSTGSRLHIYEWPPRVFSRVPPPVSHPMTSERWTERQKPGISSFADDPSGAAATLAPLIAWAQVR